MCVCTFRDVATLALHAPLSPLIITEVEAQGNLDRAKSKITYTITYTYPWQRQIFSANYSVIVVGALLLMASMVLCVGLHGIFNKQLALFRST